MPTDRWLCLQFEVPNGVMGTGRFFIDGSLIADIVLPTSGMHPVTTQMYVGIDYPMMHSSLPATDIWIDELVVDSVPTPCFP